MDAVKVPVELVDDSQAHASGTAFDDLHSGVHVERVQVLDLGFCDLADLGALDAADHLKTRGTGTLLDSGSLAQKVRCGRAFRDKGKGTV